MGLQLNARNRLANWLEMSRLFLTWSCQTRHTSVSLPQGSLQCSTVTIRHSACCHIDRNVLPAWIHQSRSFVNVKSTMLSLHGQCWVYMDNSLPLFRRMHFEMRFGQKSYFLFRVRFRVLRMALKTSHYRAPNCDFVVQKGFLSFDFEIIWKVYKLFN